MSFTPAEIAYLNGRHLGRLATVNEAGEPHVVPLRYRFNPELGTIDLGGKFMGRSKKYRDVGRTGRAAFVVDDVDTGPRGLEVRGRAEAMPSGGDALFEGADPEFIRLVPSRIVSWGIDTDAYHPNSRRVPASEEER